MVDFIYPEGKKKALTFSYDDGQLFDRRLVAILNKHHMVATFHLNGGIVGTDGFITKEELKDLYAGHEVSGHGLTHPAFTDLPLEQLTYEVMEDRTQLEAAWGQIVRGLSYPYGAYSEEVVSRLSSLGVEYGRTVHSTGDFQIPKDFLQWHPTCHHNQVTNQMMAEFLAIDTQKNSLPLLYIWGHSYEFDREQNWEILEHICDTLADKEDIWYGTNLQIKEYITATNQVKTSVDETIFYNPTATDVWMMVDGKQRKLLAGQTWIKG